MKVAVLVSGGVDSSVALHLLKEQGHDVTAFYLKIWLEDELSYMGNCPWEQDLSYVKKVCDQLNVPLKVLSLQKEYWDSVVSYTIAEIKAGRTPNPDMLCNQAVKFGAFLNMIDDSYDKVATGHYAHVHEENGTAILSMTPDAIKDQTYFLARLSQDQLKRVLFPIGHLTKADVRKIAHDINLPNKDRKDSQGICFLGKLKFSEFVKFHLGNNPGDIVEYETGTVLGSHNGFWFYTIGQRQGLGLAGGPWYVVSKDIDKNIVYVSRNYYSEEKKRNSFIVKNMNWLSETKPQKEELFVKVRHGEKRYPAHVRYDIDSVHVQLSEDDQGIAPGQFAVFYDGNRCLGSGIIQ